jgi:hypothetical protein
VGAAPPSLHACPACGSVYASEDDARRCGALPVPPEELGPGTLVEAKGAAAETGPGLVGGSYLLGLGDPRGEAHTRLYRVSFIWGRADFRAADLVARGHATEAEWRALVESGQK